MIPLIDGFRIHYGSSDQYLIDLSLAEASKLRDRLNEALDSHTEKLRERIDRDRFLNARRTA